MYEQGRGGLQRDDTEAVRYYRLAADQGECVAQAKLGTMYEQGRGVPQDDTEAARYYLLAADQGDHYARHRLELMYRGDEHYYISSEDDTDEDLDEPLTEGVNQSNEFYRQGTVNRKSSFYDVLLETFKKQHPNNEQIISINSFIAEHLETLNNDGMQLGSINVAFQNGQDYLIGTDFDPVEQIEWCLLRRGMNSYDLVTADTAEDLIKSRSRHPFIQRDLQADDIRRGEAVLTLFCLHDEGIAKRACSGSL